MKRILLLAFVAFLALGVSAYAAYHVGEESRCYACHNMHYSQTHNYAPMSGSYAPLFAGGPYEKLLRGPVNDVCLSCHDANDTKDVYSVTDTTRIKNRQAGFLNKVGDGNENKGHTLNSTGTAPGSNPSWSDIDGLNCVDCHAPHGEIDPLHPDPADGQWCNLKEEPGNASTFLYLTYQDGGVADPSLGRDVFHRGSWETDSVDFFEPNQTKSAYGAWCQGCHTDFHGDSQSSNMHGLNDWLRHPTADANLTGDVLTKFAGHPYRQQVMSSGGWGTQGSPFVTPPTDMTPSCFTCHKAHGNGNAFGLMFMTGNAPKRESGDGIATRIHSSCAVCHTQGG